MCLGCLGIEEPIPDFWERAIKVRLETPTSAFISSGVQAVRVT